jgi:hypothetical protein
MTNLKTKEEMYNDYIKAIEFLEYEVINLESLIGKTEVEIKHKNDRIEKLKETAEMYSPKQKTEVNINVGLNYLNGNIVKDFNDVMKQIDMKSVRQKN